MFCYFLLISPVKWMKPTVNDNDKILLQYLALACGCSRCPRSAGGITVTSATSEPPSRTNMYQISIVMFYRSALALLGHWQFFEAIFCHRPFSMNDIECALDLERPLPVLLCYRFPPTWAWLTTRVLDGVVILNLLRSRSLILFWIVRPVYFVV